MKSRKHQLQDLIHCITKERRQVEKWNLTVLNVKFIEATCFLLGGFLTLLPGEFFCMNIHNEWINRWLIENELLFFFTFTVIDSFFSFNSLETQGIETLLSNMRCMA